MPWTRFAFDTQALPLVQAAWAGLRGKDDGALAQALQALAQHLRRRDPVDAEALMDLAPQPKPAQLDELAEELAGEPMAAVVIARAKTPALARALLLLCAWHHFEEGDGTAVAAQLLKGKDLPDLDAEGSALYGLVALLQACELEEPQPCAAPPEGAPQLGALLGLEGEDWTEVDPFRGWLHEGALYLWD